MQKKISRVSEVLGLDVPIIQGPFGGGLSSVELTAAVSNAGGLGSFGAHHLLPEAITELVAQLRSATARPFAVNLWIPLADEAPRVVTREQIDAQRMLLAPYFAELGIEPAPYSPGPPVDFASQIDALLTAAPPVISFVFGAPPLSVVERARRAGIRLLGTATTAQEAVALEAAGVDVIVASGSDAGGHRGAFLAPVEESLVGTFSLVPQVAASVDTPVVAAGGIATRDQVRAAHLLGAEGVQIGTSFLISHESPASGAHKAAITGEAGRQTVLTAAFTGRLARGLPNRVTRELAGATGLLPYPALGEMTSPFRRAAQVQGRADLGSFWSGQSAPLSKAGFAADILAYFAGAYERDEVGG